MIKMINRKTTQRKNVNENMEFLNTNVKIPIEFISGGQFVSEVPWIHSKRMINSFEIIIGVKDILYIQQDDIRYEVKPGDVLLLLPNRVHQGYAMCSKDTSFYWFHFICPDAYEILDDETMDEEVYRLQTNPASTRFNTSIYIPLFSTPSSIERAHILFHQIQHLANSNYYIHYGVHYIATSLLIELSEQTITNFHSKDTQSQSDQNLARILEWVRIHALDDISVSAIADKFNYNKDYLSRFFKQKIGMNLQEYIHVLKISKAKDLLFHTTQTIKEIAYTVGIHDEKYFMKLFKKYEKITPTEFRKAYYMIHMNNK